MYQRHALVFKNVADTFISRLVFKVRFCRVVRVCALSEMNVHIGSRNIRTSYSYVNSVSHRNVCHTTLYGLALKGYLSIL